MLHTCDGVFPQGGDLVPSLPVGVNENWMEMGTFASQMGAYGIWPYGYAFKIACHYGYNLGLDIVVVYSTT